MLFILICYRATLCARYMSLLAYFTSWAADDLWSIADSQIAISNNRAPWG